MWVSECLKDLLHEIWNRAGVFIIDLGIILDSVMFYVTVKFVYLVRGRLGGCVVFVIFS